MTDNSRSRPRPPEHSSTGGAGGDAGAGAVPGGDRPILDQAFDGDSLPALRVAVAARAARAGLPPHRADDLVVAAHELAANAVRHGAGHGRLRLWQRENALECEVTDDGKPPAPGARPGPGPGPGDAARWPSERGHGIWLVRQVADEASLRSGPGGTVVTVSFSLQPPG
jgi:anti-sigma regulatory factor (Ser/Thr protein kinase)